MKEDTRLEGPWEFGTPPKSGRPKLNVKEASKLTIEELAQESTPA